MTKEENTKYMAAAIKDAEAITKEIFKKIDEADTVAQQKNMTLSVIASALMSYFYMNHPTIVDTLLKQAQDTIQIMKQDEKV